MTDWTTGTSPDWQFPDARCASYHPGRDNAQHTQSPLCRRVASIVSPMQAGDQYSVGTGLTSSGIAPSPDKTRRPPRDLGQTARAAMRLPMWLVWTAGVVALFAAFLRISLTIAVTSDGANNALQAWDLLHGHLLLHGWLLGDATFYTFELPLIALVEIFFGLQDLTSHVASALTYLIVTVSALALALADSRGLARVVRC